MKGDELEMFAQDHHPSFTHLSPQIFGLIYTGPANHFWHQFVARVFRQHKEAGTILRKVGSALGYLLLRTNDIRHAHHPPVNSHRLHLTSLYLAPSAML